MICLYKKFMWPSRQSGAVITNYRDGKLTELIHCYAQIHTHIGAASFTVDPQDLTAIVGDFITLNCSVQATPLPNVTWVYGNGTAIMDNDIFNISSSFMDDVTTSTLSFTGGEDMAGISMFLCVATNVVRDQQSDTAIVTIQSRSMLGSHTIKLLCCNNLMPL